MSADKSEMKGERIAKVLARAGLCSRREAERWIGEGRVAVNGTVLDTPAVTVSAKDMVTVDGHPLPEAERTRLWRYHKPAGMLTSHGDPRGRATVFGSLPTEMGRVISVGRLDYNSEGLLLLTNDGELARRLEMPATGWTRRYRVRVNGRVDEDKLRALANGITISGIRYGSVLAQLDKVQGANAWLTVSIREGKNREVRKIMEHLGLMVTRLIRTAYGPFQLGNLEREGISEMPAKTLRDQLGAGESADGGGAADGEDKGHRPKRPQRPKSPKRPQGSKSAKASASSTPAKLLTPSKPRRAPKPRPKRTRA